jgi:hypothetical protein
MLEYAYLYLMSRVRNKIGVQHKADFIDTYVSMQKRNISTHCSVLSQVSFFYYYLILAISLSWKEDPITLWIAWAPRTQKSFPDIEIKKKMSYCTMSLPIYMTRLISRIYFQWDANYYILSMHTHIHIHICEITKISFHL